MKLEKNRLSMVIHPLQGDGAALSVSSFTDSLDAFRKVATKFRCKDMQIVSLTSNSPITLTVVDAAPEGTSLEMFFNGLKSFRETGEIPIVWVRSTIDSVLKLLSPVGKSIARFSFSCNQEELELDTRYKTDFENQIQPDFSSAGTVDGMLEAVNIHGKEKIVALYPTIGNDKITLTFDGANLENIKHLIGRYVQINGEMTYRWRDKYPYKGAISSIEHINEDVLPTFKDLFGMAPNATGGVPAEDFIARIRNEWK